MVPHICVFISLIGTLSCRTTIGTVVAIEYRQGVLLHCLLSSSSRHRSCSHIQPQTTSLRSTNLLAGLWCLAGCRSSWCPLRGDPCAAGCGVCRLYLLVVNNPRYSRYVRFNCYQAILLDILLILPGLVERSFSPSGGAGLEALILFYNTVFLFIFSCFAFGSISCLLGKEPRLPVVADAADAQVPF